jgi:adenine-specific DNA-methyltransferase
MTPTNTPAPRGGTTEGLAIAPDWVSPCGTVRLWCGDALAWLATLHDASVDLICTDPPYFRVKGEWWDRQWDTPQEFVQWMNCLCLEWQRVLKPNGSLYVFASPQMAWHVEGAVRSQFNVLALPVWVKPDPFSQINYGASNAGRVSKESLRSYYPNTERIIFAEQYGSDGTADSISGYGSACSDLHKQVYSVIARKVQAKRVGASLERWQVDTECAPSRKPTGLCYRWEEGACLPTEEQYVTLCRLCGDRREYEDLRREYEDLRREYEDLRREYEDLRRPFTVTADDAYTDVWDFPTVGDYPGKHPCEKPAELIRQIVRASSRPGDTVLDCFCGSGVVGQVANELGRRAILCDIEPHWFEQTKRRVLGMSPVPKGIDKPTPPLPGPPPTQRSFLEER